MTGESGFQLKRGGPEVYELCWVRAQIGRCAEELVAAAGVALGDRVALICLLRLRPLVGPRLTWYL